MSQCTVESLQSSLADLNIPIHSQSVSPSRSPGMQQRAENVPHAADDRFAFKHRRKDQKKKASNMPRGGGPSMLVFLKDNPRKAKNFQHQHYYTALPALPGYPNGPLAPFDPASPRLPHFYNSLLFPFLPALPGLPPPPVSAAGLCPVSAAGRPRTLSQTGAAVSPGPLNGQVGHQLLGQSKPPGVIGGGYTKNQQANHHTTHQTATTVPMTTAPTFAPLPVPFCLPNPGLIQNPGVPGVPGSNFVNNPGLVASSVPMTTTAPNYTSSYNYKYSTAPVNQEPRKTTEAKQQPPVQTQYQTYPATAPKYTVQPTCYPTQYQNHPPTTRQTGYQYNYLCMCDQCDQLTPSSKQHPGRNSPSHPGRNSPSPTSSTSSTSSTDSGFSEPKETADLLTPEKRPYVYCDQNNPTFCLDQHAFTQVFQMALDPEKYEAKFQEEKRLIRKRIPCRNLSHNGVCHFGQHCWFSH